MKNQMIAIYQTHCFGSKILGLISSDPILLLMLLELLLFVV